MKVLNIAIDDLYKTFCSDNLENPCFLDTVTGKVITMSEDKVDQLPRYKEIPKLSMMSSQVMMINFANSTDDSGLRKQLLAAAANKIDPLLEYNKVLKNYPLEEEKWQDFDRKNIIMEIEQWLNSIGIKMA